jgi:hypothetical protein
MKIIIISVLLLFGFSNAQKCISCQFVSEPNSELSTHDSALCINKNEIEINRKYLNKMEFNENGFNEWYCGEKYKNVFVNKNGKIVIWGVSNMDNGADHVKNGIVRIIRNKKWGYSKLSGEIIVKATYDGALPFENGIGKACVGCVEKCVENSNCEIHYFDGGNWFEIDTLGNIKKSKSNK